MKIVRSTPSSIAKRQIQRPGCRNPPRATYSGHVCGRQTPRHFVAAERIVSQKDVAYSGHQHARGVHSDGFHLIHAEKEPMSRLPQFAQIAAGVVVHDHGELEIALEIFFDRLNRRGLTRKNAVHNVRAPLWPQAHVVALLQIDAEDANAVSLRGVSAKGSQSMPLTGRKTAQRAVQFQQVLFRHLLGSLEDGHAPGSPPARISFFSSSVSVKMRRLRISSISVESKRSPALSGAISG